MTKIVSPIPVLIDDGSIPRKEIAVYIESLTPSPKRMYRKSFSSAEISQRISFYIIENGELRVLWLFDTKIPTKLAEGKEEGEGSGKNEDKKIEYQEDKEYQASNGNRLPSVDIAPNLIGLTIDNCNFQSLDDFPNYSCLVWLSLISLPLFHIKANLRLPQLYTLELNNLNINSMKQFNWYLPKLAYLNVGGCRFRDFTFLHSINENQCIPYGKSLTTDHFILQLNEDDYRAKIPKIYLNLTYPDFHLKIMNFPALCSFDGLTAPQRKYLLASSSWYEDQFPPFFQQWAEEKRKIMRREMPEYDEDGRPINEDERNDFYDQREDELNKHIATMMAVYEKTLPELLDAVQQTKHEGWSVSFSLELIERVVHECTPSQRRSMLQVLPTEHPLHDLWRNEDSDSISLENSLKLLK